MNLKKSMKRSICMLAVVFGMAISALADGNHVIIEPDRPLIGRTVTLVSPVVDQNVHVYVNNSGYIAWNVQLRAGVPWKLTIPSVTPFIGTSIQTGGVPVSCGQTVKVWNASTWVTLATFSLFDGVSVTPARPQIGGTVTLLSSTDKSVHLCFNGPDCAGQYMNFNVQLQAGIPKTLTVPHVTPVIPQSGNQHPGMPINDGEGLVVWTLPNWTTVANLTLTDNPRQPMDFTSFGTYSFGPLDFVVVATANSDIIEEVRMKGQRVIVDIPIRGAYPEPMSVYEGRIDAAFALLSSVGLSNVYAVTLGEENIYWDGYNDVLNHLYDYIKALHPDLPIYQWYSPSALPPGFGYPVLKADGWISDEYWLSSGNNYSSLPDFEQYVRRYIVHGKPFIHMIWAAPDWPNGDGIHWDGPDVFAEQLAVCHKYNVPVAFFTYAPAGHCWGWDPAAPQATRDMWHTIQDEKLNALVATGTERISHWDEVTPSQPVTLVFNSSGVSEYSDNFTAVYSSGWCTYSAKFMQDATITGFRNLVWNNAQELSLRAAENGSQSVTLTYEFVSENFMKPVQVELTASTLAATALNMVKVGDGTNWWQPSSLNNFPAVKRFLVSVTMTNEQAVKGVISNKVNSILVKAVKQ